MMHDEDQGGQLGILLLCLFVVPAIGWLIGANLAVTEGPLVQELAYLGFGLGFLLVALIIGAPIIAGTDRARMTMVFGPLVRIVMILLAASVIVQGGLFVYSVFTLEAVAIHRVHGGLLLAVGLGAVAVCLMLLRSAFSMFKVDPSSVRGISISEADGSELISRVKKLADRLGAERPDHIVVGLEPNFFVTAAPVRLIGNNALLSGRTLFVSLSLMRIFSDEEFDAVVGHELGHFRGADVVYSMKFAPTYIRLNRALEGLSDTSGGAADLGKIPAAVALSLCLTRFAVSERTVGRERELFADKAGAEVGGPMALATALLKVSLFSSNWNWLNNQHIDLLSQGRTYTNLSRTFSDVCNLNPEVVWEEVLGQLGQSVQSHPIDTHPQFAERLESLGISLWDLQPGDCSPATSPAAALLVSSDEIDQKLSDLEAQWLLAIGAAYLPADEPQ